MRNWKVRPWWPDSHARVSGIPGTVQRASLPLCRLRLPSRISGFFQKGARCFPDLRHGPARGAMPVVCPGVGPDETFTTTRAVSLQGASGSSARANAIKSCRSYSCRRLCPLYALARTQRLAPKAPLSQLSSRRAALKLPTKLPAPSPV